MTKTATRAHAILIAFMWMAMSSVGRADDTAGIRYFEKHVRPLLADRCLKCHSEGSESVGGNLLLDSKQGWQAGGDLGPAIIPKSPEKSLLLKAIKQESDDISMPPEGRLSQHEIGIIEKWIQMGAPDPRSGKVLAVKEIDLAAGQQFWAFQSFHDKQIPVPAPVQVQGSDSILVAFNPLDRFLQTKRESLSVVPNGKASKRKLIRRLTLGLTGVLPTPAEVDRFLEDDLPGSYQRLVDRLLASPRYGEVWGRHWLDVARYADSNGLDENIAHGNAWRYRDYVIESINSDKPYSQFIKEQIAGDLMLQTGATQSDNLQSNELRIATGFLSLGPKVLAEVDESKMEMDIVDEQVDTVSRAFMALTIGCARCHDHKFDPIRTEDYYALAGIFKSTKTMEHFKKIARWNEVSIASRKQLEALKAHLKKIDLVKQEVSALVRSEQQRTSKTKEEHFAKPVVKKLNDLRTQIKQLEAQTPTLPTAMSVVDYDKPTDLKVHIRGSHLTLGQKVRRGFPQVLTGKASAELDRSGRLELANWLADRRHPLVARVIVNRIWRWHFGRGLVASTDNFGELGDRPTHPQLLDWLAKRFVEDGWSIKNMHRLIVTSATYQMASHQSSSNRKQDAENVLLWRAPIRRMNAEVLRDALLDAAGQLDLKMGGSQLHVKNRAFLFDHTSKDLTRYESRVRSVYLPVIRNHLYDVFQLFDYTDASVASSNRTSTTVAPQSMFMMNSRLMTDVSAGLRDRVFQAAKTKEERHRMIYSITYSRHPDPAEQQRDLHFIEQLTQMDLTSDEAWRVFCQSILMSNEFIYIK